MTCARSAHCSGETLSYVLSARTSQGSHNESWLYVWVSLSGWWFNPSEKYEFVSWDDDIPNIYIYIYGWKNTIHVPNHQPVNVLLIQENRAFGFFRITNQSSEFPRLLAVTRILESVAQAKGRVQGENGSKVHNGSSRNSMVPLYRWMIWMVYEQKTLTYLEMDELGVPP